MRSIGVVMRQVVARCGVVRRERELKEAWQDGYNFGIAVPGLLAESAKRDLRAAWSVIVENARREGFGFNPAVPTPREGVGKWDFEGTPESEAFAIKCEGAKR